MFLENKYTKWYYQIITRARSRTLIGYSEKHHIIPKSLGGHNNDDNIVVLTAREHFVCHLLLTKMLTGPSKYKMYKASLMMVCAAGPGQERYKVNSRIYEMLLLSQPPVPNETKLRHSIAQKERFKNSPGTFRGRKHSEETRSKMSEKASRPRSQKWKESASRNRKGRPAPNKGIPQSEETKRKISQAVSGEKNGFYGKHHSVEQRKKKSQEKLASPKKECYYCGKIVDAMNFGRWHGERCNKK